LNFYFTDSGKNKGNGKDIRRIFFEATKNKKNAQKLLEIITQYILLPKYEREKIIHNANFKKIKSAIKKNEKISINYHRENKGVEKVTIEPYDILTTKEQEHNYVYSWCEEYNRYWKFRLSNIEFVVQSKGKLSHKLQSNLEEEKKNFTAFIGDEIEVKVLIKDKYLFYRMNFNKPTETKREGDIYFFKCPYYMALAYFSQFLDKAEVLEPIELRIEIKNRIKLAYENYNC